MPTLTSERVEAIFMDCLYDDGEDQTDHIPVEGIVNNVGFHPVRLLSHSTEIVSLLNELPTEFHSGKSGGGGGWSFLNACNDRHGSQWTGLHLRMEQLFQLGMGIGRVVCVLPRDMWQFLPGGMPYYTVLAKG